MSTAPEKSLAITRFVPMNRRADDALFEHAPPSGVQQRLGLLNRNDRRIGQRAIVFALVGWVPLVALAGLQSALHGGDDIVALAWQVGVHARYLVAVPLLVLAEAACAPQLNYIARHFIASGIVDERDRGPAPDLSTTNSTAFKRQATWNP
jgi:hypothetical protein